MRTPWHPHRAVAAAAASGAVAALAACIYLPEPVPGLPGGGGWVALPLRAWVSEGGVRAEGIAGCLSAECAPRVAVGVFRATGAEARTLSGVLRDPERLVGFIAARDAADTAPQRKALRTVMTVAKLREGGLAGFTATLARQDGSRPAHAAVLGAEAGGALRLAIVIGDSPEGVRMTARDVAAKLR